jgi:hypothetical protein
MARAFSPLIALPVYLGLRPRLGWVGPLALMSAAPVCEVSTKAPQPAMYAYSACKELVRQAPAGSPG